MHFQIFLKGGEEGCQELRYILMTLLTKRTFKKQVDRNLVVTEVRARRFFEPMTEIRKKQKISARKKMLKRLYMLRRYESRL